MKPIIALLILCGSLFTNSEYVIGQSPAQKKLNRSVQDIYDKQERPQYGVEGSSVSSFKVVTRKQNYHLDEMIGLDLAVLNRSDKPIFFHKFAFPHITLKVTDDKGKSIDVTPPIIQCEGVSHESFLLIEPKAIEVESIQLVVGCNSESIKAHDKAEELFHKAEESNPAMEIERETFERNLFINIGDACLRIDKPGTYTIVAELHNDFVATNRDKVKTAVGKISSVPLTITITE